MEYVELFLSTIHQFDKLANAHKKERVLTDTSNFLSLLNLPAQIREFGPLHLYWEGNRERFIQHLKPMLNNPRWTAPYLKTRHEQLYREAELTNGLISEASSDGIEIDGQRLLSTRAYKTADHIHENLSLGLPLVGLLLSHEFTYSPSTVFVIHKNGQRDFTNLSFVPLAFDDSVEVERGARHWAPAKILCDTNDLLLPSCATGLSGLLLMKPEYCSIMPLPEEFPKPMYHVATVEWRTRNGNGEFTLPMYRGNQVFL